MGATLTFDKTRGIIFACSVLALTVAESFILKATVNRFLDVLRTYFVYVPELRINGALVLIASLAIGIVGLGAMFLTKRKGGLKIK